MKVALISDIHANIYALESVYADLDKEGVEKILIVGDLIGYYYWPKEVVGILKGDDRVVCVRGNHESILHEVMFDKEAADRYRKKYGSGYDSCLNDLSAGEIDWLVTLPKSLDLEIAGCTFYLSHGGLGSIDEYLYPDAEARQIEQSYSDKKFTVFGHTHYSFLHSSNGRFLINPGSVGQPRDIAGSASYVILNLENSTVRFKRKSFDVPRVVEVAKERDPQVAYLWKIMSR